MSKTNRFNPSPLPKSLKDLNPNIYRENKKAKYNNFVKELESLLSQTDVSVDDIFDLLLELADNEGYIGNAVLQKAFGINFYMTLGEQKDNLLIFGIPDFLDNTKEEDSFSHINITQPNSLDSIADDTSSSATSVLDLTGDRSSN